MLAALGSGPAGCDDSRPASWSYIHEAIIEPSCTQSACHSRASSAFGVELHDAAGGYFALTGRVCGQEDTQADPPRNFVTPGDPARSKLMHLLRGEEVRNMPPDVPLPDVDIALIEEWILRGAPCD